MKILLLGPPASGKDTQAENIAKKLKIPLIGTGSILRERIKTEDETGIKIKSLIDKGNLVPDEMLNDLIKERLSKSDCDSGCLLNGYPRNISQAEFLSKFFTLDKVLYISCSDESVIKRISSRRMCSCGATYNLITKKPITEGICDVCKKLLEQREDDKIEVIKKRLEIYHKLTQPLVNYYKEILIEIDGEPPIKEVEIQIEKVLRE